MLTPLDIENEKFSRGLYGYKVDQVEDFMEKLLIDYEKLYKENIELRDKVSLLNDSIQYYKSIEDTLQSTVMLAQNTGEDIKKSAYEKADNIIKETEMNAKKMLEDINKEIVKKQGEYEDIKSQIEMYVGSIETALRMIRK